jgi:hypothetical protein
MWLGKFWLAFWTFIPTRGFIHYHRIVLCKARAVSPVVTTATRLIYLAWPLYGSRVRAELGSITNGAT